MKIISILLMGTLLSLSGVAEEILLARRGGVFYTPVTVNGKIRLEFVVDSGASLVYLPRSVFEKLKANGSLKNSDILGKGKSRIANGDIVDITIINIKKLKIGQTEIENVRAGIGGENASTLLGQSALKKLEPWSLDTQKSILSIASSRTSPQSYVSSSQKIGRTEILDFIHHYTSVQSSRSLQNVTSLYASKVDYLNKGTLPKEAIAIQKEIFFRKWQKIHINLIKLIEIKDLPSLPNQKRVKYSVTFDLYNDFNHKGKSGQSVYTVILKKSNGMIQIVSEKVKLLSQNSY